MSRWAESWVPISLSSLSALSLRSMALWSWLIARRICNPSNARSSF